MSTVPPPASPIVKALLLCLGFVFVALGFIGLLLPVVPTTPFLLLALWAFARSSRRFHCWLLQHRLFGPTLKAWESHRVIPRHAKILAVTGMAGGLVYVFGFSAAPWYAAVAMAVVCAYGAWFVLSKPSTVMDEQRPERG